MKLVFTEINHLFNRKFLILMAFSITISFLMGIFVYKNSIYSGVIENGEYKEVFGSEAISTVKNYSDKYYGYISDNKLINAAISHNDNINSNTSHPNPVYENLINEDTSGLMYSFLYTNNNRKQPLVEWKDESYIPEEVSTNFYKLRLDEVRYQAKKNNNLSEINRIEKMENSLKKPFYIEKSARFWRTSFEFLNILFLAAMIICTIFVSPLFSRTYENGTRDIIMITKLGKSQFSKNRILASYIMGSGIFIATTFPFLLFIYSRLGLNGLNTSFQYISLFSSFNGNLRDVLIYSLVGAGIGNLAMIAFTNAISVFTKKSYATGVLSLLLIIANFGFNIFFRGTSYDRLLMKIVNLTPMNSSQYMFMFSTNQFVKIFNYPIYLPFGALIYYVGFIIVLTFVTAMSYRRRK